MQKSYQMKTSKIGLTLLVKSKVDTLTRCFQNLIRLQILKIQIILLSGNFNIFWLKSSWKCHKTHNRPLPWQQMSKRLNLFILFMYTQRPFTSQLISKIYFLTFASYIEKLPETTINICDPHWGLWKNHHFLSENWKIQLGWPIIFMARKM